MLAEIDAPKPPQKAPEVPRPRGAEHRELRPFAYD
jgi:hypothetical protein